MPKAQIHCPATSRRAARTESAPLTEESPAMSLWWLVYHRDDRMLGVVIVEADGPAARVLPGLAHSTSAG